MRVVLITGGSSGIGRATALAFAREGASVVISSRGAERGEAVREEIRALGVEAEFVCADVANSADVQRLVDETVAPFGKLDVAVSNAASIDVGVFKRDGLLRRGGVRRAHGCKSEGCLWIDGALSLIRA